MSDSNIPLTYFGKVENRDQKPLFEKGSFFDQIEKNGRKQILEAHDSTNKISTDRRLNAFDWDAFNELLESTDSKEDYLKMRDLLADELNNIIEA